MVGIDSVFSGMDGPRSIIFWESLSLFLWGIIIFLGNMLVRQSSSIRQLKSTPNKLDELNSELCQIKELIKSQNADIQVIKDRSNRPIDTERRRSSDQLTPRQLITLTSGEYDFTMEDVIEALRLRETKKRRRLDQYDKDIEQSE